MPGLNVIVRKLYCYAFLYTVSILSLCHKNIEK